MALRIVVIKNDPDQAGYPLHLASVDLFDKHPDVDSVVWKSTSDDNHEFEVEHLMTRNGRFVIPEVVRCGMG